MSHQIKVSDFEGNSKVQLASGPASTGRKMLCQKVNYGETYRNGFEIMFEVHQINEDGSAGKDSFFTFIAAVEAYNRL